MSDFKIGLVVGIGDDEPEVQDVVGAQLIKLYEGDYVVLLKIKKDKVCPNVLALEGKYDGALTSTEKAEMITGLFPVPPP